MLNKKPENLARKELRIILSILIATYAQKHTSIHAVMMVYSQTPVSLTCNDQHNIVRRMPPMPQFYESINMTSYDYAHLCSVYSARFCRKSRLGPRGLIASNTSISVLHNLQRSPVLQPGNIFIASTIRKYSQAANPSVGYSYHTFLVLLCHTASQPTDAACTVSHPSESCSSKVHTYSGSIMPGTSMKQASQNFR